MIITKTARMPRFVGGDEWLCNVCTSQRVLPLWNAKAKKILH